MTPDRHGSGQVIDWKPLIREDLREVAARHRWGLALIAVGWVHLAGFLACQAIYDPKVESDPRHLGLWVLEFFVVLGTIRLIAGRGWHRASPGAALVVRVWGTFLVLGFNLAVLNAATGWSIHWFKLAWTTLSSSGFAMMAWLTRPWWLVPAVAMFLAGRLMAWFPHEAYLIYGLTWWAVLQGVGAILERDRRRSHL